MSAPATAADSAPGLSLARVAELAGGRLVGDGAVRIASLAPIDSAGPDALALLAARRYAAEADGSDAAAFLVSGDLEASVPEGRPRVVVEDAHRAMVAVLEALHPAAEEPPEIHPTAVVGRGARLGEDVALGPYAVVEDGARVGARTRIGAHCVVGAEARIGEGCRLHPHVVLYRGTVLGDRVVVHSGARLGVDGFGWVEEAGLPKRIPHVGRCVVGDDVEIGANTTLDRGSIGDTTVGPHAKLDNLVHLAHNVRLGPGCLLAALVGIAGSTRVGAGVLMGGQAGVINHLEIGDGARVAAAAKVLRDVPAGETVSGLPARPNREYLRKQAHLERLPKLVERVRRLEEAAQGRDEGASPGGGDTPE